MSFLAKPANSEQLMFDKKSDIKLFKYTCLITGLYLLWIAFENLYFGHTLLVSFLFFTIGLSYILIVILFPNKTLSFINSNYLFYSLAFFCLNIGFLLHGGFLSPVIYFIFPFILMIIYANKRKRANQIIYLLLTNLLLLYSLNYMFPEIANSNYSEKWLQTERIVIQISMLFLTMLIINDLFNKYEADKTMAKDSEKAKEAFLENMSHLIRTPINAINGYSDLLLDDDVAQFEKKIFKNRILLNAKKLHRMIFNLVDLSIIQESSLKLREYRFKLSDIVNSLNSKVLEEINHQEKVISYHYYLDQNDADIYLYLDGDRIFQMIWNLIENSINYSAKGTIELIINLNFNQEYLEFIIKDSGFGMDSSLLEQIHRQSILDNNKSTVANPKPGMGINISKGIIEACGGKMDFISKRNHGTQVSIQLPIHNKYEKHL